MNPEKISDPFSALHPAISFLYFAMTLGSAMFLMNPVMQGMSLAGAAAYYFYLKGRKVFKTTLLFILPVFVLSTLLNPLFNHQGVTVLFYFWTGNAVTLEAVLYGMGAGLMLASVISWFSCYQAVMTSDKFIYLFGKLIPALSLILSMVLRFVPKYKNQIVKVSDAQKCIGRDVSNGNVMERASHGMRILSVMLTWALENSVETADSMRSRGYGLRGRSSYTIYRFDSRDKKLLTLLLLFGSVILWGILSKSLTFLYYPAVSMTFTAGTAVCFFFYGILCFLPFILDIWEELKWHYLRSKI